MSQQLIKYEDLSDEQLNLLNVAEESLKNSYNPYSGFCVGAALLSEDGEIINGANYENASYGLTICAERSALVHANAKGIRKFKSIAVIGRLRNFDKSKVTKEGVPVSPCGPCRQMLFEASQMSDKYDMEVIMSNPEKTKVAICSIKDLIPLGFGPEDLGIDISYFKR